MDKKKQTIRLVGQVLKARAWSEESAKSALHDANAVLDRDVVARDAVGERIEQNLIALRGAHAPGGAALDLDRIRRLRQWQGDSELAMDAAQATVEASAKLVDDARDGLSELVAERRALQTLQERLIDRVAGEQARVQARLVDESYAAGLARQQEDEHGAH